MLSRSVVEAAKHMNAQARVNCGCTFFFGFETLPPVIQRNGIEWWPYTQAVLVPSIPKPPTAYVLAAYGPPSDCGDPDLLEPLPPARPVLGAGPRS